MARRISKLAASSPLQIQSRVLREMEAVGQTSSMFGLATPADAGADPNGQPPPRKARWRETDLRRAIGAAKKAGLRFYSVEVAPDGTISIVVGPQTPNAPTSRLRQRFGKTTKH